MSRAAFFTLLIFTLTTHGLIPIRQLQADDKPATKSSDKPIVQIAVLLDTSGSMQGLIEQAKSQLWKIVNEFSQYKKNGQRPDVFVSLYHYGSPSLGADNGFVRQILPLSLDLDRVSDELFKLTINGGDEYCGAVIDHAVANLPWSKNAGDLKLIFVAGNEAFNQGHVAYQAAVEKAVKKGIIVNTIFCGNEAEGINTHWKTGADLGGGAYSFIDRDKKAIHIESPQDTALVELSAALNKTYIPFGESGVSCAMNQTRQDFNAVSLKSAAAVERAATKASAVYKCSSWDLVDASKDEKFDWKSIQVEYLPEALRKLSTEDLKKHVQQSGVERESVQKKIRELQAAREIFVTAKMKELAKENNKETLEIAIIRAIRKQAQAQSFVFESK